MLNFIYNQTIIINSKIMHICLEDKSPKSYTLDQLMHFRKHLTVGYDVQIFFAKSRRLGG